MPCVLVVDDEPAIVESHLQLLGDLGYRCLGETDALKVDEILADHPEIDLLLMDIQMPAISGIDLTRILRARKPFLGIVLATVLNDIQLAVQATKSGAYNYLLKPVRPERLKEVLSSYFSNRPPPLVGDSRFSRFISGSPQIKSVFQTVSSYATGDSIILLEGETGTGKELIAESIHAASPRAAERFVAVNVASLSEDLFEMEMFGNRRGAYTGASEESKGYLETAGDGTLFLDEIGELGIKQQAKLLRVLQTRRYCRVGETTERELRAGLVFATNRDLRAEIEAGRFRSDLYFRLAGRSIKLPPLRERVGDIRILAEYFLGKYCSQFGRNLEGISAAAMEILEGHNYPGNVRELEGIISGAILLESGNRLNVSSLPWHLAAKPRPRSSDIHSMRESMVYDALAATGGNQTQAAKRLKVSRQWLNKFLRQIREKK